MSFMFNDLKWAKSIQMILVEFSLVIHYYT